MATTRNRRLKASPSIEEKPVESPQVEENNKTSKPDEKKVEPPKKDKVILEASLDESVKSPQVEEDKETPVPVLLNDTEILKGSRVKSSRGVGTVILVKKSNHDRIKIKSDSGQYYYALRKDLKLLES